MVSVHSASRLYSVCSSERRVRLRRESRIHLLLDLRPYGLSNIAPVRYPTGQQDEPDAVAPQYFRFDLKLQPVYVEVKYS